MWLQELNTDPNWTISFLIKILKKTYYTDVNRELGLEFGLLQNVKTWSKAINVR